MTKAAHKLSLGFQQWAMNNHPKNDTQLLFASAALRELHARIEPEERLDYLLTFQPPRLGDAAGAGRGEELEHPQARIGWRQYSINCMAGARPALGRGFGGGALGDPPRGALRSRAAGSALLGGGGRVPAAAAAPPGSRHTGTGRQRGRRRPALCHGTARPRSAWRPPTPPAPAPAPPPRRHHAHADGRQRAQQRPRPGPARRVH
jgi:hypothetical protein